MAQVKITMKKDKDCKYSVRYADKDSEVCKTVYIDRKFLGTDVPETIVVDINTNSKVE